MKKYLLLLLFTCVVFINSPAQVAINTDGSLPDNSAILDVKSTTKGVLLPRMTYAQRSTIQNPPEGLMVFCTDCSYDFTSALTIFMNGYWNAVYVSCIPPTDPTAGIHIVTDHQIEWKWDPVPRATGYKWNTTWDYANAIDMGTNTSKMETGISLCTTYNRYIWAYNECTFSSGSVLTQVSAQLPPSGPTAGTHAASYYQIVWNWNSDPDAAGYKWSPVNDYNSATDLGDVTTKTEYGLDCGSSNTRYVWSYNNCGNSAAVEMTQSTAACPSDCLPLNDSRNGKTYQTVMIGTQCWMKQNLNFGNMIDKNVTQTNNGTFEKYCYDNTESNCDFYGAMYQWGEMMNYAASSNTNPSGVQGLCPEGWHVPSESEWCQILTFLDYTVYCGFGNTGNDIGIQMKTPSWGGTNVSGFTALPSGWSTPTNFFYLGSLAAFWSSLQYTDDQANYHQLSAGGPRIINQATSKLDGISLRCVKN